MRVPILNPKKDKEEANNKDNNNGKDAGGNHRFRKFLRIKCDKTFSRATL